MKLIVSILILFYSVSHTNGQEPKMRFNIIDNQLNKNSLTIKNNDSIRSENKIIMGNFYDKIYDDNLIVIESNNSYIYIHKGNYLNYQEFVNFFGVFTLDKIPNEKGTFLISIGSDSNNPLYCNVNEKDFTFFEEWGECINKKKFDIQQNIEMASNEYYLLHRYIPDREKEYRGLEITLKGIIGNKISDKIISPQKLEKYINNTELERPEEIEEILSVFEKNKK